MTEPANLDDMSGWIYAYLNAEAEKQEWEPKKKAWEKKWKPFIELFKEELFERLGQEGTDTGTVQGKPVIRAKETKVKTHEVKAHTRREIIVIEDKEEDQDTKDLDK